MQKSREEMLLCLGEAIDLISKKINLSDRNMRICEHEKSDSLYVMWKYKKETYEECVELIKLAVLDEA